MAFPARQGIRRMGERGRVAAAGAAAVVTIEDNAGAWQTPREGAGLGMQIVDKRVKNLYGEGWGVTVECVPQQVTRVIVRLPSPAEGAAA